MKKIIIFSLILILVLIVIVCLLRHNSSRPGEEAIHVLEEPVVFPTTGMTESQKEEFFKKKFVEYFRIINSGNTAFTPDLPDDPKLTVEQYTWYPYISGHGKIYNISYKPPKHEDSADEAYSTDWDELDVEDNLFEGKEGELDFDPAIHHRRRSSRKNKQHDDSATTAPRDREFFDDSRPRYNRTSMSICESGALLEYYGPPGYYFGTKEYMEQFRDSGGKMIELSTDTLTLISENLIDVFCDKRFEYKFNSIQKTGYENHPCEYNFRLSAFKNDVLCGYPGCIGIGGSDGVVQYFVNPLINHTIDVKPDISVNEALKRAKRVGVTIRLSERFRILTHHYGFEPCFARVGEGHDKGGVESRGKGIRLQHLTPIPQGDSLEEIIRKALSGLEEDAVTRRNKEGKNVMERFEEEKCHMTALATRPYDPREIVLKRVSNKSMVTLAGAHYSLPCHWAQSNVTAHVGVTDIHVVWKDEKEVLPRIPRGKEHIQYRHYLRELSRKPQAVRQVMPKLLRELGFPFDLYWSRLQVGTTELEAARVFARTLGLVLDHGEESVSRSLETMLKQEKLSLLEMGESLRAEEATVRVPVALCGYRIESARAADYDVLLGGGQP